MFIKWDTNSMLLTNKSCFLQYMVVLVGPLITGLLIEANCPYQLIVLDHIKSQKMLSAGHTERLKPIIASTGGFFSVLTVTVRSYLTKTTFFGK